jgi:hypothetical protein
MTVQEQHIDFKRKLNKIDTAVNVNIEVPFIDEYLNEAQEIFIKRRIQPNNAYRTGFENTQKRIEDLKDIVKRNPTSSPNIVLTKVNDNLYSATLPVDYLYYIRGNAEAKKGTCKRDLSCIVQQHDDLNNVLDSQFYSPSFEWGETPIVFANNQIYIYSDGTFELKNLKLDYIRRPARIANPDAFIDDLGNSGYLLPITDSLGNFIPAVQQDCELQSMYATREIVDIAVELAHIDLGDPKHQLSSYKNKIFNE